VLEEAQEIDGDLGNIVLLGENHDGVAADEGTIFVESSEIERHIGKARRQNAPGGTAWKIGFELMVVFHAARELDQLTGRDPGGRYNDAGLLYPSRNGP